jgi:CPA2 family monovalent cation:H+ antiporter-2
MMVIADDNPAMAHRIVSVARQINPTMRIVVRTRYTQEVDSLSHAGADTVIAEELESIVQLFGEVLRDYRISAERIEAYEDLARHDGYSVLFDADVDASVFRCDPGQDCFDSRTVTIRDGAAVVGRSVRSLMRDDSFDLTVQTVRREGEEVREPIADIVLQPGDELVISGSTQAFANSSALFRSQSRISRPAAVAEAAPAASANGNEKFAAETGIGLDTRVTYAPTVDETVCSHLDRIKPVFPSAPGCEECLTIGADWVHLRLCLTCGHVGCCDTSDYKHASAHYHDTEHPVMKSIEVNDNWAWCFVDEEYI